MKELMITAVATLVTAIVLSGIGLIAVTAAPDVNSKPTPSATDVYTRVTKIQGYRAGLVWVSFGPYTCFEPQITGDVPVVNVGDVVHLQSKEEPSVSMFNCRITARPSLGEFPK